MQSVGWAKAAVALFCLHGADPPCPRPHTRSLWPWARRVKSRAKMGTPRPPLPTLRAEAEFFTRSKAGDDTGEWVAKGQFHSLETALGENR
jgi:hypothetical protein